MGVLKVSKGKPLLSSPGHDSVLGALQVWKQGSAGLSMTRHRICWLPWDAVFCIEGLGGLSTS